MGEDNNLEQIRKIKSNIASTKAYSILESFFDDESFSEIDTLIKHQKGYAEVVSGFGLVNGYPVYAFAQNYDIDGGAVSKSHLIKISKVYDLAIKTGLPVVGIYSSVGARLYDGTEMLSDYGELLMKCNNVSGVIPQISVILGPCIGTNAMIASAADVIIMTKDAELGIGVSDDDNSACTETWDW